MQNLGYVLVAVGFLFGSIGGLCLWYGQRLIENPPITIQQVKLEPEARRLLQYLYELQTKTGLHKISIGIGGSFDERNNDTSERLNVIKDFFEIKSVQQSNIDAFEKLISKIPATYLLHMPEPRRQRSYVFSVTPEGILYLKYN